jgi:hypothetical protein
VQIKEATEKRILPFLDRHSKEKKMQLNLPGPILLDVSILFTAIASSIGFTIADKRPHLYAALANGCFVCLAGYSLNSLGVPTWAAVPTLIPLDMLLLWYVMRTPRKMAIAYGSGWCFYLAFHVALSAFLRFDYLIPAWRLHV